MDIMYENMLGRCCMESQCENIARRSCVETMYGHLAWKLCVGILHGNYVWKYFMETLYGFLYGYHVWKSCMEILYESSRPKLEAKAGGTMITFQRLGERIFSEVGGTAWRELGEPLGAGSNSQPLRRCVRTL